MKWQLNATESGVKCYYRLTECNGQKLVFLKFENTNRKAVSISWNESFVAKEDKTAAKQSSFGIKEMELLPGIIEAVSCESADMQGKLITRPRQTTPVYRANIISFSFTNVIVKK